MSAEQVYISRFPLINIINYTTRSPKIITVGFDISLCCDNADVDEILGLLVSWMSVTCTAPII